MPKSRYPIDFFGTGLGTEQLLKSLSYCFILEKTGAGSGNRNRKIIFGYVRNTLFIYVILRPNGDERRSKTVSSGTGLALECQKYESNLRSVAS